MRRASMAPSSQRPGAGALALLLGSAYAPSANAQAAPSAAAPASTLTPANAPPAPSASAAAPGANTQAAAPAPSPAPAQPPPTASNEPSIDFSLPTTQGRTRSIAQYRGRVVVVFYETRDSTSQNQHVKDAIGARIRQDPSLQRRFALVPVANVGEFAFWPAEHFAREAISAVARANNVELWFDWQRTLVRQLRMRDGVSNIAVLDRTGRLRRLHAGRLSDAELPAFLDALQALASEP